METIYVVRRNEKVVGDKVFRTFDSALREKENREINTCREHNIISVELPFAKRSICRLRLYRGYDYDMLGYGSEPIYDVVGYSEFFACSDYAKQHKWWKDAMRDVEKEPKEFHVTNSMIASDDYGDPFMYGDCFMGKYNLTIERFKVVN